MKLNRHNSMNKSFYLIILIGFIAAYLSNNAKSNSVKLSTDELIIGDTSKLIDSYLTTLAAEKNFSGALLIIKDNKKIFSKGYGWADKENKIPFTPGTLASIGSITKAFTAAAIMKLAEQNKLSPDDKLVKFFPAVPQDKEDITIHQLLTHSSGFPEFLMQDGGDYETISKNDFLKRSFAEPLTFKPGEKAVYSNIGYSLLGIIIEQVSGQDYEFFLKTNLFEPIGIKNIGYHFPVSKNNTIAAGYQNGKKWGTHQERFEKAGGGPFWNLKANGGLQASLNEMFLWLNSFAGYTVLTEASIKKMFTSQIQEEGYNGESWFGYGCNISRSRRNTRMISNGGSNGIYFARIIRLPEENLIFYMVTNESSINTNMVLPNITQLYFQGIIENDFMMQPGFEYELSEKIYSIINRSVSMDLGIELKKENIRVDDDMVLLEVGQRLMQEKKDDKALILYKYYTQTFPKIAVAWNELGDIYLSRGNKEEALKCYKQALTIKPENQRAKESIEKLR